MVSNARGTWQFLPLLAGAGPQGPVDLYLTDASVVLSFSKAGNSDLINGRSIPSLFGTDFGADYAGPIVLPPVYTPDRKLIPYRQTLQCNFAGGVAGCVQTLQMDPAMYSDTHHLEVRFLTLEDLGSTTPADLYVEAAAVLLRISNYNPGKANIDGMPIFLTLRTGPVFDVRQDWPPVYDPDWRVIPYRHHFRFSAQGGQPITGAFTLVDIVPNR